MDKVFQGNRGLRILSAGAAVLTAILISLFNHWEPGGETWGYWFFARIFAQTGKFVILDRSPLYTLYLNLFRWLGYPASVTAEYIVTSCIVIFSLTAFFRRYLGLGLAVFATLMWLYFLQIAEPPVQKLALACSCLAIVARGAGRNKFHFALSYALLGLAYLFRNTYILMLIVFALWDIFKVIKHKGIRPLISKLRPRLAYWPVLAVIALLVLFSVRQSAHPWNNVWFASTKWFPNAGKTQLEGSLLRCEDSDGGMDFYFSSQKFRPAESISPAAVMANSKCIAKLFIRNTKNLLPIAVSLTDIFKVYSKSALRWHFKESLGFLLVALIFAIIVNGALRATKEETIILFIVSNLALICVTVLSFPKTRYMVSFIPVLILSAGWYGIKLRDKIIKWSRSISSKFIKRWLAFSGFLCVPLAVMVFSNGASNWLYLTKGLAGDLIRGKPRVLEAPDYIKGYFPEINRITRGCTGIMALESTFIGAFTGISVDKVYDVWEIPPFGEFGNPVYDGLASERVNCLLISSELKRTAGGVTNSQVRYQNYIKPYVEKLRNLGADTYELGKFGEIVILRDKKIGEKKGRK